MHRPSVLLVEDDVLLQRFVEMVLEDLPIALTCCGTVDEAMSVLQGQTADMVITDLMLPGRSGLELLEGLDSAELRGPARRVVFSAGLTPDIHGRLKDLNVWRVLTKPCSAQALEACVREGLLGADTVLASTPAAAPTASAVERHFGGNEVLFRAFHARCVVQFSEDIKSGDQACSAHDAPALHHMAHSLKSVLLTLGYEDESACARRLEDAARQGAWAATFTEWQHLKDALRRLA